MTNTRKCSNKSRQGCLSCKQRRKKCDEGKPSCKSCNCLGLKCSYVNKLYWHKSKQSCGAHYIIKSNPSNYTIQTTFDDVRLCLFSNIHNNSSLLRSRAENSLGVIDEIPQIILSHDQAIESQLFTYYIDVLSKKKVFEDCQLNEFRSIIIPCSISLSSLFQSVMAIAASDLIRQSPQNCSLYLSLTNKYKNEAINMMYNLLDDPSEENMNEILISILLLCSLEIGECGNNNWITYLKQSCLIFQRLDDRTILFSKSLMFCYRYFILRYILLLTTFDNTEFTDFVTNFPMRMISDFFTIKSVDYMLGCSPYLLRIIYDVTVLRNKNESEIASSEVLSLYNRIISLVRREEVTKLDFFENLYINSLNLYFENIFKTVLAHLNVKIDVNGLHQDLLQKYRKVLHAKDLTLLPGWTLLISSIGDIDDYGRIQVLESFYAAEIRWPRSSGSAIRDAVEAIWKFSDLNKTINWRKVLSIRGYKLPLT
ncbi:Piso0_001417 [Millerozyma farinosa CBS 7064]|uniref:Piso0_001417 protein n=1 Tax=Pichia sorbitophila (strain ATCC MYA-4447 / BCRC 22081 / CBS 7064 / NBRC 10061 / NRRL Y-12695) TaxID=559304 RepID=G8YN42_PICSO|nr:Piso0_001417 [Millerozyma farinosa CBS 7064]